MMRPPRRGLDGHVEQLARDEFLQLGDEALAFVVGILLVDDRRQRIHRFAVDQDFELLQLVGAVLEELVIERGIAACATFEFVEEVQMISESGISKFNCTRCGAGYSWLL